MYGENAELTISDLNFHRIECTPLHHILHYSFQFANSLSPNHINNEIHMFTILHIITAIAMDAFTIGNNPITVKDMIPTISLPVIFLFFKIPLRIQNTYVAIISMTDEI